MTFDEVLGQVQDLLQREKRVSYRGLKRRFALDDEYLDDLKEELIGAKRIAVDEDGRFLVWRGDQAPAVAPSRPAFQMPAPAGEPRLSEAERRQLTVMFCDLVGSTTLSAHLDPEELREVVRAYQQTSVEVIERYAGYVAQYLGDGLLVYFGYPTAHEDDATRAVRAGLGILKALSDLSQRLARPLQVRIGIHTGPVVVGEMGGGSKHEQLALGETPNIAARVQGKAEPDEVVMSAATHRLVEGLFECEDRGLYELKGISTPQPLYRVTAESMAQSRFEAAVRSGLTPLVGREAEVQFLQRRWEQARAGEGQAVLVSGEPGIGKSRLVQELKEWVTKEGAARIEFRCSPYHQNSALYPVIEHVQRLFQFQRDDTADTKLGKLQQTLASYKFPQADTVPLLASLLSLPQPEGFPPLTLSPQKQKEKTQETLVRWLFEEAEQHAVYCSWEDLHWADPSTLELLTLWLDQIPTARMLALLVFRPEFIPPWGMHSYLSQLTLSRLGRPQVERMVERVTGGRALPAAVVEQVAAKTDGVPLFVEELTKMLVESGVVQAVNNHYELTGPLSAFAIPSTLQDSLMARLDRLATAKEVAQLGATLGREFSYELLHAIAPLDDATLQHGLKQLVDAELLYQRGLPPQAIYRFKHALVQDTAYESLLKRTRQQMHHQIAQVLEERFVETVETQPELVAHHYTEAGLVEQAVPYWQQAGQRAVQRSAHAEAVAHFTKGLELLKVLPETSDRTQHELTLQTALGSALLVTKGLGAPEARKAYDDARELCQRVGETPQLGPVLTGLSAYYIQQEEMQIVSDLAEQCLAVAEKQHDASLIVAACRSLVNASFWSGNPMLAHEYCERAMASYDVVQHRSLGLVYGFNPVISCLGVGAWALWYLGYPDQALKRSQAALALAYEGNHPYTLAFALNVASWTCFYRREGQAACTLADEAIALSSMQEFPHWLAMGRWMRGQALVGLGQWEEGTAQLQQGLEAYRATGAVLATRGSGLAELARGYGYRGQVEEGLRILAEALAKMNQVRHYEAEMYRLKGELLLAQEGKRQTAHGKNQKYTEAEECFLKAVKIARNQKAKSWELRTATSLARLWQCQDKKKQARQMLAEIYGWFTEGFETRDLQEAQVLLEELT